MNVFLTGGAGYVGSHCVRHLCDLGYGVTVLDDLSAGHRAAVDRRATLMEGALGDYDLIRCAFSEGNFNAVMHFAAFAEVGESVKRPLDYYRNNVAHTVSLLEAMRDHDIKSLVFSSTCATYGTPARVPITEDIAQLPINPYGRTKLAMEWALRDCADAWGLGATALRYFNAAGASADGTIGEDHDPESHLIPRVLQVALGQYDSIKIFGEDYPTEDGTCVRDYVHVEDLASAHAKAIETQQEGQFRYFNLGTGVGASVKSVIEAARNVTGHEIPAIATPRRPGDPPALYADPTKANTQLDWHPKYTNIDAIVETAWAWHQHHPKGYEK